MFHTYQYELRKDRLEDLKKIGGENGISVARLLDYSIDRFRSRYWRSEDERAWLTEYLESGELPSERGLA